MRYLTLTLFLALVAIPTNVSATCFDQCAMTLRTSSCDALESGSTVATLYLTAGCETCCSAPGGPSSCMPYPSAPTLQVVDQAAAAAGPGPVEPEPGTFFPEGECESEPLYRFDGDLGAGDYFVQTGDTLAGSLPFSVQTDEGGCSVSTPRGGSDAPLVAGVAVLVFGALVLRRRTIIQR